MNMVPESRRGLQLLATLQSSPSWSMPPEFTLQFQKDFKVTINHQSPGAWSCLSQSRGRVCDENQLLQQCSHSDPSGRGLALHPGQLEAVIETCREKLLSVQGFPYDSIPQLLQDKVLLPGDLQGNPAEHRGGRKHKPFS